jgi:hypothetical protein
MVGNRYQGWGIICEEGKLDSGDWCYGFSVGNKEWKCDPPWLLRVAVMALESVHDQLGHPALKEEGIIDNIFKNAASIHRGMCRWTLRIGPHGELAVVEAGVSNNGLLRHRTAEYVKQWPVVLSVNALPTTERIKAAEKWAYQKYAL